jgi:response regulator RpfG family c-di-GMP phosphodiesterase
MSDRSFVGKKIIVVDDNEHLRHALQAFLETRGFAVTVAPNGKVARELIQLQVFDVVLSDVQMPFLDGVELLKWIKANRSDIPVIMMTAFTNLLETRMAHDLGASDFVAKPFKNDELMPILECLLLPKSAQKTDIDNASIDELYCKVSLDEFVANPKIDFDIYVKLGEKKIVKIGHAGDNIPTDRIQSYKDKGLKYLHIRREDFQKIINFNIGLTKIVAASDKVSKEKKLNFMRYTGEVILEKAFVDGVDRELFTDAKDIFETTVSFISENPEQLELLEVLNSHTDWLYAHSVASGMFAMMIARKLGHTSTQTFFKLGMSGLFHEIGFKEIPKHIIDKPRPLLTQDERAAIESHVSRGRDILSFIKNVPGDVIEIIYQHHEDILGQGYPRRLVKKDIYPLAKIFQVADLFCDFAMKGPQYTGFTGQGSVQQVESFWADRVDKDALNALKGIFHVA